VTVLPNGIKAIRLEAQSSAYDQTHCPPGQSFEPTYGTSSWSMPIRISLATLANRFSKTISCFKLTHYKLVCHHSGNCLRLVPAPALGGRPWTGTGRCSRASFPGNATRRRFRREYSGDCQGTEIPRVFSGSCRSALVAGSRCGRRPSGSGGSAHGPSGRGTDGAAAQVESVAGLRSDRKH